MARTLDEVPTAITAVDFRRPSRIGRDAVLVVESAHDALIRRLATAWRHSAHAAVEIEHVATDQASVDDYVRALPSPTVLAQLRADRLGATLFLEIDLPLALVLTERILGGPGDARIGAPVRRPTDLETALIEQELVAPALPAIDDILRDLEGEPTSVLSVETSPEPVQMSASSAELLVLLTFRVEIRGDLPASGLVTVAYPVTPLLAHVDHLLNGHVEDGLDPEVLAANRNALLGTQLEVRVELGGTTMHAGQIAALTPGDVLRLDHHVLQPARLTVAGRDVGAAHLGKRGRKTAVQLVGPPTPPA